MVLEYADLTNRIGVPEWNGLQNFQGPGPNENAGPQVQKGSGISGW